ncbi:hypothetical protein [Romboutsia ilealis]|uniref:hypothetical protein n=1 Tax=Romboutsia ilealis TaxID=1115758 RepID=UPI0023F23003|nr:hypothetical protein [Romboutsia ilealis]
MSLFTRKVITLAISSILSLSILTGCNSNEYTEEQVKQHPTQQITMTIDEQYEIANELIDSYMNNKEINYIIEENRDSSLIVVKLPVNDINFRLAVVQQEGYAKEMLNYISTHSKSCMELITENGCNNLGVEFAIVPENNTDNAFLATINGVTIINVIKDYTDIK